MLMLDLLSILSELPIGNSGSLRGHCGFSQVHMLQLRECVTLWFLSWLAAQLLSVQSWSCFV